jgi:hypothetical protein
MNWLSTVYTDSLWRQRCFFFFFVIPQKLRRGNGLEAINESVNRASYTASQVGVPEMRHFLYKCRSTAQFWSPALEAPYHVTEESERLLALYQTLHYRLHAASRPLKLLHQQQEKETMLGWVSSSPYHRNRQLG